MNFYREPACVPVNFDDLNALFADLRDQSMEQVYWVRTTIARWEDDGGPGVDNEQK